MAVSRIQIAPEGPVFSRFAAGFWRLADWRLTPAERLRFIERCLDLGISTMDHSDIYGGHQCERLFGEALALRPGLRGRMEIVTKCGIKPMGSSHPERYVNHYDTSREHILASVDRSLENLGVDEIDLLLIHRPDPLLSADEVGEAFGRLKKAGKVKHFGVSNFSNEQFHLLQSRLDFALVNNQVEISPYQMNALHDGTLDLCQRLGISPLAWSCLAGGRLFDGEDEKACRLMGVLGRIAREVGADGVEPVAYAWVLRLPCRPVPILGSGKIERVERAVKAEGMCLDRQQWFSVWEASMGCSVP